MIRYPKGVLNPEHTHPSELGYSFSKVEYEPIQGVYGTGTWVWLPQGETMEHRSTDEGDMARIFIIDGALEIHYKNEK